MIDEVQLATAIDLSASRGEVSWALESANRETLAAIAEAMENLIDSLYERNAAIVRRLNELVEQYPELAAL